MRASPRIAVIGAGLAGLACARALWSAGWRVTVLDKGRGPGGRTSTRREGSWRFDHGAPRLELGAPALAGLRADCEAAGVIVPWQPRVRGVIATSGATATPHTGTWLGVPGASALAAHLARELDLRTGARVIGLVRDSGWWLVLEPPHATERIGPFEHVVITSPAPQTRELLATAGADALASTTTPAQFAPCLAAMVVMRATHDAGLDELRLAAGPLASAHRMDHRPGRVPVDGLQAWVLHGGEAWSTARLEDSTADTTAELTEAFAREVRGELVEVRSHRWRYARATVRVQAPCAHDPALGLGLAGDWFEAGDHAPAASRALLSGAELARAFLGAGDG